MQTSELIERLEQATGRVLILPLKGIYFDQIKSGEKPEEYREATPYWEKRLQGRDYDYVVLTRGYPKGGGVEGETRLTREWRGYRRAVIKHPHFGEGATSVFAIDVSREAALRARNEGEGA